MGRPPKTQIAEDGEKIPNDLPPAGTEHAHPDAVVVDDEHVEDGAEKVQTKNDDDVKLVNLTVTKDHAVFDGDGAYYKVGTKLEGIDEETAKSLRDKGVAK